MSYLLSCLLYSQQIQALDLDAQRNKVVRNRQNIISLPHTKRAYNRLDYCHVFATPDLGLQWVGPEQVVAWGHDWMAVEG
jgi:hypothetical protein